MLYVMYVVVLFVVAFMGTDVGMGSRGSGVKADD